MPIPPGTPIQRFDSVPSPALRPYHDRIWWRTHLASGHLLCLRTRACRLIAPGPVGFLAVRFRAGALRHFTATPLADLNDRPPGHLLTPREFRSHFYNPPLRVRAISAVLTKEKTHGHDDGPSDRW